MKRKTISENGNKYIKIFNLGFLGKIVIALLLNCVSGDVYNTDICISPLFV